MPKLIVMLRVKDGIFFVEEWLHSYEKIADEIVVLDNGSTDGTYEALLNHPKVTLVIRTEGYNEGRDKNLMYDAARSRQPDWCLWIDIDEIFEPDLTRADFDRLMNRKSINKYTFRRFHFIDRTHFAGSAFRLNYSAGHDRMLWRENPSGYFENLIIDSPNVKGIPGIKVYTNFRLRHLGYINKDLIDKKRSIYRDIIPEKESTFQEMYLHNERRIAWINNRNHPRVVLLNGWLNCLLAWQLIGKAWKKSLGLIKKNKDNQTHSEVSANHQLLSAGQPNSGLNK